MLTVTTDDFAHRPAGALGQQGEFRPHTQVVPHWQYVTLAKVLGFRAQVSQSLGDSLPGLGRRQCQAVVVHHQGGVGRHQIGQILGEANAQALAGSQHPRHVGFCNFIEQTQHQAVDGHHFNARLHPCACWLRAWRIRCTAATEPALSPCTHSVLACRCKALPSLATRGWPAAMVRACCTIISAS